LSKVVPHYGESTTPFTQLHPFARFTSFATFATFFGMSRSSKPVRLWLADHRTAVGLLGVRHAVLDRTVDGRGRVVEVTACGRQLVYTFVGGPDTRDCPLCFPDGATS